MGRLIQQISKSDKLKNQCKLSKPAVYTKISPFGELHDGRGISVHTIHIKTQTANKNFNMDEIKSSLYILGANSK